VRVSALIVSYNTRDLLLEALASLASEPEVETIVVDKASHDGSADAVAARFPAVQLIRSRVNLGFAAGVNLAAGHSSGERLLLLNPDARLCPGALKHMERVLALYTKAAAVGPALVYTNGQPQDSAFLFPGLLQVGLDLFLIPRLARSRLNGRIHSHTPVRIDHPLGACMLIRRAAWDEVGPFDEGYFMYVEEIDWCRRARDRGWEVWYTPAAVVVHQAGAATSQLPDAMFEQLWRSRLRYYQRFHGPVYNRLMHGLVRLGIQSQARRAGPGRQRAIAYIRQLVG
jgi:GT2 family glycosyltransferase